MSLGDRIRTKLNYQTLCRPSGEIVSGGSAGLSLPPEAFFGIEIARKVEVGGGGVQSGALRDLRAERRAPCSVELTSYPPLSGQWWNIANNCNQLAHRPFLSATILIHYNALSSSFCLWMKGNLWGEIYHGNKKGLHLFRNKWRPFLLYLLCLFSSCFIFDWIFSLSQILLLECDHVAGSQEGVVGSLRLWGGGHVRKGGGDNSCNNRWVILFFLISHNFFFLISLSFSSLFFFTFLILSFFYWLVVFYSPPLPGFGSLMHLLCREI